VVRAHPPLPGRSNPALTTLLTLAVLAFPGIRAALAEPFLEMARPQASLTFGQEWSNETLRSPLLSRTQRVLLWRTGLKFSTHGSIYHRKFLRYTLRLHPEWNAQTASGTVARNDRSWFLGYLVNGELLERKRVGLSLSSQQRRGGFTSSLSSSRVTRSSNHRASLRLRARKLPTTLTWDRNDIHMESVYTSRETSHAVRLDSRYPGRENSGFLRVADIRQARRVDGSVAQVDVLQGSVGGRLTLGEDWHLNSSVVSNRSDSGALDLRYLVATTRLDARHGENLTSHFQIQRNDRRTGTFRSDSTVAEMGLEHQLFENLTTTVNARTAANNQSIGDSRLHEAGVHFNYVRRIPWGQMGATHGQRLYLDNTGITSPITPVFNEEHTLTGTTPSFLTLPNVDRSMGATFEVTDLTGTIVYLEGIDYTVITVGNATGVVRDPVGGIASGQLVLVDYSYASQLPYTVMRRAVHTGASLDLWQTVRLFARVDSSDIHLRSGTTPTSIGDDRSSLVGTEVRWKRSTTRLEFEDRDTVVTPFTRLSFRERVQFPVGNKASGGVNAERVASRYPGTGQWTTEHGLSGDLRLPLFGAGSVEVRAALRNTRGTLQRNRLSQLSALWAWRLGDWNGSLGVDTLRERDRRAVQFRSRDRIMLQAARVF